jgi:hypothetical protein
VGIRAQLTIKANVSGQMVMNVIDVTTGKTSYISMADANGLNIIDAQKFTTVLTIQDPDVSYANYLVKDTDKNGSDEFVVIYYDKTNSLNYFKLIDIKSKEVLQEWKGEQSFYPHMTVSSDNHILLEIEDSQSKQTLFYDLGTCNTSSSVVSSDAPSSYGLKQNFPNPFNPSTTIGYTLSEAGPVKLNIYDISGKLVRTINESASAGSHHYIWNGLNDNGDKLSSGMYIYQLETKSFKESKKMLMLK